VTDGDLPTRLLAFLEGRATTAPAAASALPAPDSPAADAAVVARLRAAHAEALPERLAAIRRAARAGDAPALAAAATALAGSSGQLGDPAVARLSGALARQARRGVVDHALVAELTATGAPVVPGPRTGQATSR
jgi:AcrR family transcriptional regulator